MIIMDNQTTDLNKGVERLKALHCNVEHDNTSQYNVEALPLSQHNVEGVTPLERTVEAIKPLKRTVGPFLGKNKIKTVKIDPKKLNFNLSKKSQGDTFQSGRGGPSEVSAWSAEKVRKRRARW